MQPIHNRDMTPSRGSSPMRPPSFNAPADEPEVSSRLEELRDPARKEMESVVYGVDIVVVHGLEGDLLESSLWKSSKTGCRWVQDILPETIPQARLLLYKYDAQTLQVTMGVELNRLMKAYARRLLLELARMRETLERPILFVGNGFGGLIVKQALIYSHAYASIARNPPSTPNQNQNTPPLGDDASVAKFKSLKVAAQGVVFFGTPHRGWKDASGVPYYSQLVPPPELELNKTRLPASRRLSIMGSLSELNLSPALGQGDGLSEYSTNGAGGRIVNNQTSFDGWLGLEEQTSVETRSGNNIPIWEATPPSPRKIPESINSKPSTQIQQWAAGRAAERAFLQELSRQFQHICTQYKILSVFATKPSKTRSMTVSQYSAVLDVATEEVLPLDVAHADLVKFDSVTDRNYKAFAEHLTSISNKAIKVVAEEARKRQKKQQRQIEAERAASQPSNNGVEAPSSAFVSKLALGSQRRKSEPINNIEIPKPTRTDNVISRALSRRPNQRIHPVRRQTTATTISSTYFDEHPLLEKYFPLDRDIQAAAYTVACVRTGQSAKHEIHLYDCLLHELGEGNFPWLNPEHDASPIEPETTERLNGDGVLWVHVAGNDRSWVEDVIAKVYESQCPDPEQHPLEIMGDEYWKYKECNARYGASRASRRTSMPGTLWMEPSCNMIDPDHPYPQCSLYMPYLHWETKAGYREQRAAQNALVDAPEDIRRLYEEMNYDDSSRLRSSSLLGNLRHHPRRTLDAYYYSSLEDTKARDDDQIVGHKTNQLLMVDQLWIWVTGKDTMFTFFPEKRETDESRSGKDLLKTRFADLRDRIIRELEETSTDRELCSDAFELAALAMKAAVNVLLDPQLKNAHQIANFRVLQIFQDTITETTEKSASALREFVTNPEQQDLSDISSELDLLWRVTDLEDELKMVKHLLYEQKRVLDSFREELVEYYREQKSPRAIVLIDETLKDIETYEEDVENKEEAAGDTRKSLAFLLDLKQKSANLQEARVTREQQERSVQQSRVMMVFTTFTVIFLPLSFFTSLYGMNVREWSGVSSNPKFRSFAIFAGCISSAIILITLTFAFYPHIGPRLRKAFRFFMEWRGRRYPRNGRDEEDGQHLLELDSDHELAR